MNKEEINQVIARYHNALDILKLSADEISVFDKNRGDYINAQYQKLKVIYRHIDWLNK